MAVPPERYISIDPFLFVLAAEGLNPDAIARIVEKVKEREAKAEARGRALERAGCAELAYKYGDISIAEAIERRAAYENRPKRETKGE